jgi:hypothetical protein
MSWQDADGTLPARVHDAALEKLPGPVELKLTVPVGVTGLEAVSVTVAVHVLAVPVATGAGEQLTLTVEGSRTGTC